VTLPKLQNSILSLKSWLFTPATKSDRFARVADVHADALIVDLEDSAAPSAKKEARETTLRYLAGISADHMPLALRLNSPETRFGLDDLQALPSIAELIPEHACLQIGVGGVPSGVCEALMHRKDLGIHTEVLNPALAQLVQSGVVTNRWKKINPGKSVFTFAMGDEPFYDFLHDNIAIESHPVNYVNDPAVIALNDNVVSVNSTIEMDLTGACNSEYVRGHQFTSTGGQLDFVRGAYASKGGMSFIAFQSAIKEGKISKIVSRLSGPVTTPRTDVHYVDIENGVANLKGLSSTERAQALIAPAHPAFQDGLTAAAKENNLL